MLRFFRAFAKSWAGPVIMGLLVLAFGILGGNGMKDVLNGRIANAVIQAGDRSVTQQQFERVFNNIKRSYEEQSQSAYPLDEAVKAGVDQDLVERLAQEQAYYELLARSGIKPSDAVLAAELRKEAESGQDPALTQMFDSVTGKFKPQLLAQFLNQNNLTQEEFDADRRDSLANEQFGSAVSDGFRTPRIYAAVQLALNLETRDISYFVAPQSSVPHPAAPTDAQLNALIQQYADRLTLPERRTLTIVRFSAKAMAPSMPVDPAQVQQQFNAKKDSYGKAELRSLVEIPINDPKAAAGVVARLKAGQDPNAVAKSIGVDAVAYTDQPESAIADVKAGAAAFALKAGEVSQPVQGDIKTVVIKVTKITPGQAPSIDAARPQIQADLQESEALDKVYDVSQKFEDARQGGDSIAVAAGKVGVTTVSVGPVTAEGKDLITGQVNPVLTPKLLKTAFAMAANDDSDVEQDADKGEYYAVHVDHIQPSALATLNDPGIRPAVTQLYYQQAVVTALKAKADAASAAITKGQTMDAAAAAAGGHVIHQVGLQRVNARQYEKAMGDALLQAIFSAKPNVVFTALAPSMNGYVVGRIDTIHPADPKMVAAMIDPMRQRADQTYLEGIAAATRAAAMKMVKPITDLALADSAIGIDAAMIAKDRPKTPAKGAVPAK